MKSKPSLKVPSQLSSSKRYELTSLAIGWFIAFLLCFIDYSFNCNVFRFFTAYYIPVFVCCCIDIVIMIFGIFNAVSCVIALLDFSTITNPFSFRRSFQNQPVQQPKESDALYRIFNGLLEGSWINRSSNSDYSPPSKDYFLTHRCNENDIIRRSSSPLIHDIYNVDQIEDHTKFQLANFAHKTFEPKIKRFARCKYPKYHAAEKDVVNEYELSPLDRSELDILLTSLCYDNNPEMHPLDESKSGSDNTNKGLKRKALSLSPTEKRIQLPQTNYSHTRPKNATFSRSPKFLKNLKPTLISITKLFRDNWHVSGEHFTIMMEDIRRFISQLIIQPLAEEICSINKSFVSNNPTRNVVIGKTSIAVLEKIFGHIEAKKIAKLPHVLAYLRLDSNYNHLVKRILTWAQSETIFDYFPDKTDLQVAEWPKSYHRATKSLPTDSELIFRLFCHFMDTHSGLYPITYPHPCDLPFTGLHVLTEDEKPSELLMGDNGYYVEICDSKPVSFKFHTSRYPKIVTYPTSNALVAILMLLTYGYGNEWYEILSKKFAHLL